MHPAPYLEALERQSRAGGGQLDADTVVSADSWRAAVTAAGTGLAAVDALATGAADAAFLAVRPPGSPRARRRRAMGFCLLNNVAVAAAALADRGERVLIVDYDAHHGNGTQEIFYADPRVLYVSFHEWPLYPGTGRHDEIGARRGRGHDGQPAAARGRDRRRLPARRSTRSWRPQVERFAPTWVLISAGFDAHRADPLTGLGLSAGDYADDHRPGRGTGPRPGRLISFLEGGYDLDALRDSVAASLPTLIGAPGRPIDGEPDTSGGPGTTVVDAVADLWRRRDAGLSPTAPERHLQDARRAGRYPCPATRVRSRALKGTTLLDLDNLLRESVRARGVRRPHQGRLAAVPPRRRPPRAVGLRAGHAGRDRAHRVRDHAQGTGPTSSSTTTRPTSRTRSPASAASA